MNPLPEFDPARPLLNETELAAAAECGRLEKYPAGASVFRTGDTPLDCFVVVSGKLGIVDITQSVEFELMVHIPGAFSGEIGLLAGRTAHADGRAVEALQVIRLDREQLRRLMSMCPSILEKWVPALLIRRERMLASGYEGLHVFGPHDHPPTLRAREFLHRNGVPHRWFDVHEPECARALAAICPDQPHLPVVAQVRTAPLIAPDLPALARLTGVAHPLRRSRYDVVIIGAGPAGLGAAVYAASEGMHVLVLDRLGPGGQASSSSRIENYAGFPEGISGRDLAMKIYIQALKFGAEFGIPGSVASLRSKDSKRHEITLEDGTVLEARAVVVATGVSYRQMTVPGLAALVGAGIYYSATQVEAMLCRDKPVHVIGAGNSAGQAAMYLSQFTSQVNLVVRGSDIYDSMSNYLADRVVVNKRIRVRLQNELRAVCGGSALASVILEDTAAQIRAEQPSGGVFIFIGATPCTGFLGPEFARDQYGFLATGAELSSNGQWPLTERMPLALETSVPGVIAAGDCRGASTKRVAFAVGDGALAVTCIHELFGT